MTIRPILVALGVACIALAPASAFAQEDPGAQDDPGALDDAGRVAAGKLSDPAMQMAAAAAMAAMAETILDMDIGPLTRAMDAAGGGRAVGDLPRDAKLRDLAGPDAERLPRTIARNVPKAMGSAGEMAGALEDMMPQLRETARKLKDAIPAY